MSRKTQEAKQVKTKAWKRVLFFRRWALTCYLAVALLCLIGSQGPWYQTHIGEKPLGDTVYGTHFAWDTRTTAFDSTLDKLEGSPSASPSESAGGEADRVLEDDLDAEPPAPGFWERPGFLCTAVLWCSLGALCFAGYNLASNATLDVPVLIVSLAAAAAVGTAFYALSVAPSTLRRVIEEVTLAGVHPGTGDEATGVAAIDSGTALGVLNSVSMRFSWGAALMGASAPVLVLVSLLLTFFLKREP